MSDLENRIKKLEDFNEMLVTVYNLWGMWETPSPPSPTPDPDPAPDPVPVPPPVDEWEPPFPATFYSGWPDVSWADPAPDRPLKNDGEPFPKRLDDVLVEKLTFLDRLYRNGSKGDKYENVIFRNCYFNDGLEWRGVADNVLFEDCVFLDNSISLQGNNRKVRFRNCKILDVHRPDRSSTWPAKGSKIQGIYASEIDGLHIDECLFDYVGWRGGYDLDRGPGPQPPTMYSHTLYVQRDCLNVGVEDSLFSRAASTGFQMRSGGLIRNNVIVDCGVGFNCQAGENGLGNQSWVEGNIVAHAARKPANGRWIGAQDWSWHLQVDGITALNNVWIDADDPNITKGVTLLGDEGNRESTVNLKEVLSPTNIRHNHILAMMNARRLVYGYA